MKTSITSLSFLLLCAFGKVVVASQHPVVQHNPYSHPAIPSAQRVPKSPDSHVVIPPAQRVLKSSIFIPYNPPKSTVSFSNSSCRELEWIIYHMLINAIYPKKFVPDCLDGVKILGYSNNEYEISLRKLKKAYDMNPEAFRPGKNSYVEKLSMMRQYSSIHSVWTDFRRRYGLPLEW